jgi:hypothetical protein
MNTKQKRFFERRDLLIAFYLFVFVCSVYLLTTSGAIRSDGYYYYVAAVQILSGERPTIEDYRFLDHRAPLSVEGDRTTQYGLGWSAALVPIVFLCNLARGHLYTPPESRFLQMAVVSSTSFISAATVSLLYLLLRKLGYHRRTCVFTAFLLAFSTMLWTYSRGDLLTEPITALAITAALLAAVQHGESGTKASAAIAGLFVAYVITIKIYWIFLTLPFLTLMIGDTSRKRLRNACAFLVPFAAAMAAICLFNKLRFGVFIAEGYLGGALTREGVAQTIKGQPILIGLHGLLFSSGKSVFLFNPPLIMGMFGARRFWRESRRLARFCLLVCAGYLLFFATRPTWGGGNFWGPRHLCPLLPVMIMPLACLMDKWDWRRLGQRALRGAALTAGILIQFPNLFIFSREYMGLILRTEGLGWEDIYFVPNLSPMIGNWVLFKDYLVNLVTGEPIFFYPVKIMRGTIDVLKPVYCLDFADAWDSWINVIRRAGYMDVLIVKIAVFTIVALLLCAAIFAVRGIRKQLKLAEEQE